MRERDRKRKRIRKKNLYDHIIAYTETKGNSSYKIIWLHILRQKANW